ncbi:MAG: hypothetical protein AAFN78_09540 [Pseudomonadota bacterium]
MGAPTIVHVLPGDSLVEPFAQARITGEALVCRECLVDGDVQGATLDEVWAAREAYLSSSYPPKPEGFYRERVRTPLESLLSLTADSEVNLWFENELFCQVNLWFCLHLLKGTAASVYRVAPVMATDDDRWGGFCDHENPALERCFAGRQPFSDADRRLGADLWQAYQSGNQDALATLAKTRSPCFPYLDEVVEAAIAVDTRPAATLKRLIADGNTEFPDAFRAFCREEAVYGFGDLQVKRLFDAITAAN